MSENIAMYMRLSKEDEKEGLSESIVSQKSLINEFILNDIELSQYNKIEFIDDGYSGYNLNRPAISDLIEQVKNNKIKIIIVKDISRFGRNNLEILPYIDKIFPFMGVRFISILENLDTSKNVSTNTAMDISIKSMINDFYVKDLSKKRKAVSRMCAERGIYTSGSPAFGYTTDKKDKKHIVVDEVPANIVRNIFNYAMKGRTTGEIATVLNTNKIITPIEYRRKNIFNRKTVKEYKYNRGGWTNENVKRILKNEVYTGTFIAYKRLHTEIKSNKTIANDEKNWIKLEDNHEAIIDREIFDFVQNEYFTTDKRKKPREESMFARKVFCGHCGKTMRNTDRNKKYFRCVSHRYTDNEPCIGTSIPKEYVENLVLKKLKKDISDKNIFGGMAKDFGKKHKLNYRNINLEISRLKEKTKNLFEKYINGEVNESRFVIENEKLQEQIKLLQNKANVNNEILRVNDDKAEFSNGIIKNNQSEIYQNIIESDVLTVDIMRFVNSIRIYSLDYIEIDIKI